MSLTEPSKASKRAGVPLGHNLLSRPQHGGGRGGGLQGLPEVEQGKGQLAKGHWLLHGGDVCYESRKREYLRHDQGNDLAPDQPG